ncbi:MAG: hypothetical protein E6G39_00275 [Actinobacteria bacterium]|nr:MAG: hypothetical protein E6G39_00275 [Actinomycetota bacterium]
MPVSFLDPRPQFVESPQSFERLQLRSIPSSPTIGLLANGFPDSAQFLDALAQRVAVTIDRARFERVTKVSPPTPLTATQLSLLTESCDAVIAAYGH